MCLYKKHILPKYAFTDIPVYKYLDVKYEFAYHSLSAREKALKKKHPKQFRKLCESKKYIKSYIYYTPYRHTKVNFNEEGKAVIKCANSFWGGLFNEAIGSRGVHACTSKACFWLRSTQMFNAYIPKGTWYYEGKNNDIAAQKLVIIKDNH